MRPTLKENGLSVSKVLGINGILSPGHFFFDPRASKGIKPSSSMPMASTWAIAKGSFLIQTACQTAYRQARGSTLFLWRENLWKRSRRQQHLRRRNLFSTITPIFPTPPSARPMTISYRNHLFLLLQARYSADGTACCHPRVQLPQTRPRPSPRLRQTSRRPPNLWGIGNYGVGMMVSEETDKRISDICTEKASLTFASPIIRQSQEIYSTS